MEKQKLIEILISNVDQYGREELISLVKGYMKDELIMLSADELKNRVTEESDNF